MANEVQILTNANPGNPGQFQVAFRGSNLTPLLDRTHTTAAQLQAALTALPSIGAGNVTVTGNAGGPYTITFQSTLGNTELPNLDVTNAGTADFSVAESVARNAERSGRPRQRDSAIDQRICLARNVQHDV